ncbi:MAG: transglutaminase-like domain-containing protein [Prevotellaceae bacterium]|jgi:transglutaminase-like putative cysteine protease|nr:transglutaminase-like domain-containing protein [Prevotellaceae bacterium]
MKKVGRYNSSKKLLWQLVFLCLPLSVHMYFLLYTASAYYEVLNKQYILQSVYFATGVILACIFYSYRFRFLPAFLCLLVLFWLSDKFLDNFAPGEFDSFFLVLQFSLFTALFTIGWLCGWGFARIRVFPVILSIIILLAGLFLFAKTATPVYHNLLASYAPLLFFAFYIIYMGELVRNTSESWPNAWWRLSKHLIGFTALMLLLFLLIFTVLRSDFQQLEDMWGHKDEGDDPYSMMEMNKEDSTMQMKGKLPLQNRLNRGSGEGNSQNRPLFVAYLDNFFPNSKTPNPLYFVTDYFTKFDDYTETFEPDSLMPYDDLFRVNLTETPLYFTAIDTNVLNNGMSVAYRKIVDVEVYKIAASPKEFTAPTTAFFVQPIAVEKEMQGQYKSAYLAKSLISELNSAYFVYNISSKNYSMQRFQQQRFDVLRTISDRDYKELDTAFMNYYTQMPENPVYDTIAKLANYLTKNERTPIDKVLAIRDYFMSGNEEGKPLFKYSNTSGPVPAGSRLLHFLLNERRGYCAHFAGATLFLLRACGIPARLAIGYLIEDRSTKNPGWYWVYEKQSHAWVQVFFPEYGWLDFDTTVGDEEQREAGQADGTPPLDPRKAWFAGTGSIVRVDSFNNTLDFSMNKMAYHDTEYQFENEIKLELDMHVAKVYKDSIQIRLGNLQPGDKGMAISFAQAFADMPKATPKNLDSIIQAFPSPAPIDEFRISTGQKPENQKPETKPADERQSANNYVNLLIVGMALLFLLLILVLLTPWLIHRYYRKKALRVNDAQHDSFYSYRAAMYLLNQLGIQRHDLTPLQYARKEVDAKYETDFERFVLVYLKIKYANQTLSKSEKQIITYFYQPFETQLKSKFTRKQRISKFINIYNTLNYFTQSSKYGFTK